MMIVRMLAGLVALGVRYFGPGQTAIALFAGTVITSVALVALLVIGLLAQIASLLWIFIALYIPWSIAVRAMAFAAQEREAAR